MRVITGSSRGRRLVTPNGDAVRPTTDNVKESVFSIIQFSIEGRQFLDAFAGSGQMGIEALSRGAAGAVDARQGVRLDLQLQRRPAIHGEGTGPCPQEQGRTRIPKCEPSRL